MPDERSLPSETEIAIIGAGPAGLAAAGFAAAAGAKVVVLDEQASGGGQIYRGVGSAPEARARLLGPDYRRGAALLDALDAPGVTHLPEAIAWDITRERTISFSVDGAAHRLVANQIIIATGATERPMPFSGWTLPGVLGAGAAQILLKTAGLLPPQPLVLAGSGPLLYLLAVQYLDAGQAIAALVETTPAENRRRALRHLPGALRGHASLRKGLAMLMRLRRAGVPHYKCASSLVAHGDGQLESITFDAGGSQHQLDAAALVIHTGVVPSVQASRLLELEHDWDPLQACWRPRLDAMGRTGVDGILIAGDGGGIGGAEAAVPSGRLAAFAALEGLGRRPAASAQADLSAQSHHLAIRPFLDALYAPAAQFLDPPDDTIICRCEEVTAAQVRGFVDIGCLGPNQAKSYGRCGMGPCQGRYCGLTVSTVMAARRRVPVADVGYFRVRPPLKPVTLGELAALDPEPVSEESRDTNAPAA